MLVVVSDTSPLRCLNHIEHLALLEQLFSVVVIPPAVVDELRNPMRGDICAVIMKLPCVRVQPAKDRKLMADIHVELGLGESEAIALACEIHAPLVLMDEKRGRAECRRRNLETMGVLGLLARAKHRGLVDRVAPLMDRLRTTGGFFISDHLRWAIMNQCGEVE